ncbi:MAG: hypothetical protein V5A59_10695 [Bacteroidales bacterium]|nr:hypothetical protein [Bacteroidales bacterium]MBS3775623.1 hypothetical protein [Bacteroidales bacterium]
MEQRDYILREIEKIHVVLQALLGRITGGSTDLPPLNKDFEQLNKQMINDTRVDLNVLLKYGPNQMDNIFKKEYGYSEANIELFADMLAEMAKKAEGPLKDQLNQKALETYEFVDSISNSFSFDRRKKMDVLRKSG